MFRPRLPFEQRKGLPLPRYEWYDGVLSLQHGKGREKPQEGLLGWFLGQELNPPRSEGPTNRPANFGGPKYNPVFHAGPFNRSTSRGQLPFTLLA